MNWGMSIFSAWDSWWQEKTCGVLTQWYLEGGWQKGSVPVTT